MERIEDIQAIQPVKLRPRAILPCCGYGTRMGMKPDQSKELLIDPTTNEPIIQWHINLCKKYDLEPLFIIRPEKTNLIEYLKDYECILYTPKENEEWMWTIYNNKEHFGQKNVLLLPDTVFSPEEAMGELKEHLEWLELVCLTHEVEDVTKWGVYHDGKIWEKSLNSNYPLPAWGVLGFNLSVVDIFKQMGEGTKIADVSKLVKYNIPLDGFKDLTRTGKIE